MIEHLRKRLAGKDSTPARIQINGAGGFLDVALIAVDEVGIAYVDRNVTVCRPWGEIGGVFPGEHSEG